MKLSSLIYFKPITVEGNFEITDPLMPLHVLARVMCKVMEKFTITLRSLWTNLSSLGLMRLPTYDNTQTSPPTTNVQHIV